MSLLLENEILRLRALEPDDLDVLYIWENDSELWEYGASIAPFSRFVLKQYIIDSKQDVFQNKQLRLMIELKSEKTAIGTVDLYDMDLFHQRAGVGILIDKNHRNKGFAAQTLQLLEEYAFGFLMFNQLYAHIPEKNAQSVALFKKSGYELAGTLKKWLKKGAGFENVLVMQKIISPMA